MITSLDKPDLLDPRAQVGVKRRLITDAATLLARARRWSMPLRGEDRTPALTLELPDRTLRLRAPKVLEFVLASRTQFPISRLSEAMGWSPRRLERASAAIRIVERRLSEILTRSLRSPADLDELLASIEPRTFSKDHQWRDIMEALFGLPPQFAPYKRIALTKYLQYLSSRRSALKGIFMDRTDGLPLAGVHATPLASATDIATELEANAACELDEIARRRDRGDLLATLPKGETLCLHLGERRAVPLSLAGNPFRLEAGPRYVLVDDGGNRLPLKPGKNVIGRHPTCDVQVDAACRAISRRHLVVEPLGEDTVLITDVSAHGTQIPASLV